MNNYDNILYVIELQEGCYAYVDTPKEAKNVDTSRTLILESASVYNEERAKYFLHHILKGKFKNAKLVPLYYSLEQQPMVGKTLERLEKIDSIDMKEIEREELNAHANQYKIRQYDYNVYVAELIIMKQCYEKFINLIDTIRDLRG